ncbi:carbohydrate kinase family protein [Cellulomonas sp. URHD0024]|uniref:carbohydrate kinase family protein n=1 Tax=Cellulomonas sp. URHD0024 TaxID=1302620 RepID=UPI000402137C|nr:carbohydrate kinase family protein [Cellulomonas sp. URHD0024]
MLGVTGDLVEDVVVWLAEPLRHGTDARAQVFRTPGGSGANVARFAAGLVPTRFLGCVGPDRTGDALVDELTAAGVDVRVRRTGRTGTVVLLIDETGERTMFPDRAASALLDDIPSAWLDGLDLLHVPGYSFEGGPTAASVDTAIREARVRGIPVSVDASSTGMLTHYGVDAFRALLADLAPDLLLANASEAALLGMQISPRTTVVVKAGADPTVVHLPDGARLEIPVPPVPDVRDLTGAGDAFAAGFLAAFVVGRDLRTACDAGHRSAARVLSSPGATTNGS